LLVVGHSMLCPFLSCWRLAASLLLNRPALDTPRPHALDSA
jgi:hypothetical protein